MSLTAPLRIGALGRALDSDFLYAFRRSPVAVVAFAVVAVLFLSAFFAPWIAPQNPFDAASLNLLDSFIPPVFLKGGGWHYVLGTDDQGRDVLSALMYGMRLSLYVGFLSIGLALLVGVLVGLVAGYAGGALDAVLMRAADVQLTFPSILIALLIDGVALALLPRGSQESLSVWVLILAIGIARWPQFARTVRGSTMVERGRDYVLAARVIGIRAPRIVLSHILPNVLGPVFVISTINLGLAVLDEATLSFLGVGLPPTHPSLGTLIRIGEDFLYSGQWWVTLFPGIALALLVLSVNLLGDWLRDALNPRLQ